MQRTTLIVALVALTMGVCAATNTWKIYDQNGLNVNCIALEGNIAWMGTDAGVVRVDTSTGAMTLTEELGIPRIKIYCIVIDANGVKQIGSCNGLISYDGVSCSTWIPYYAGSNLQEVTALAIDKTGNLWLGCYDGIYTGALIKQNGGMWTPSDSQLPGYMIEAIAFDSQNRAWIGTRTGLARFDGTNWAVYTTDNSGIPVDCVTSIAIDSDDVKWIGTYFGGVAKFSASSWRLYTFSNSDLPSNLVNKIVIDNANHKWIATSLGLVAFYATMSVYSVDNSELRQSNIDALAVSPERKVFLGFPSVGAQSFDGSNWTDYHTSNCTLPSATITAMHADAQNNIWFGTIAHGVGKYDRHNWQMWEAWTNEVPSGRILNITTAADGTPWVGTKDGLMTYNGSSWTMFTADNSPLPENWIHSVAVSDLGKVYVGTSSGLSIYNGDTWTTLDPLNSTLPTNVVASVAATAPGIVYLGSWGGGLILMNNDKIEHCYNMSNSSIPTNFIRSIHHSYGNNFWLLGADMISGDAIVIKFDGESFTGYTAISTGLPIYFGWCISADSQNRLWLGTIGQGVFRFDGINWIHYTNDILLLGDQDVRDIAVDGDDNVWLGTDWGGGITVYNESGIVANNDPYQTPVVANTICNYPNPFNPQTTLKYELPAAGEVSLVIYNLKGQKVRTLIDSPQQKGSQTVVWNGTDDAGRACASGIYLSRLRYGNKRISHKMMLMK